jgi:hypothetical protein
MSLQPEQIVHINIVNWFNHEFPELADDFHHFANERTCSVQQGRTLKRMGVKKGVADFFLALPQYDKSGLWIELKVGKNTPTKEQKEFLLRKASRGYEAICVWGASEAKDIILDYLVLYILERENNKLKKVFNDKPIC